jgi:hypothetical protein
MIEDSVMKLNSRKLYFTNFCIFKAALRSTAKGDKSTGVTKERKEEGKCGMYKVYHYPLKFNGHFSLADVFLIKYIQQECP